MGLMPTGVFGHCIVSQSLNDAWCLKYKVKTVQQIDICVEYVSSSFFIRDLGVVTVLTKRDVMSSAAMLYVP